MDGAWAPTGQALAKQSDERARAHTAAWEATFAGRTWALRMAWRRLLRAMVA